MQVMNPGRPPVKHKKGIQILQPCHPTPRHQVPGRERGSSSMYSAGGSRGISMSRQTGITVDKIYDVRHFLPAKSSYQLPTTTDAASSKGLASVKSLKLMSMFGQSQVDNSSNGESRMRKPELEVKVKKSEPQGKGEIDSLDKCSNPIFRLQSSQFANQALKRHLNEQASQMTSPKGQKQGVQGKLNILKF